MVRKICVRQLQVRDCAHVYIEGESYPSPNWEGTKSQPKRIVIFCLSCINCQVLDWLSNLNLLCLSCGSFWTKNCRSHWHQSQRSKHHQKAEISIAQQCVLMSMGRHMPTSVLLWSSLLTSKLCYHWTIAQKTSIHTHKIFKPTLHSLGQFLGKSLNVREFKTFKIGGNHSRSLPFSLY